MDEALVPILYAAFAAFCFGGQIVVTTGALSMYSALNCGRVVVVSPIIATFPVFTLVISLLFRQERFRLRILTGMMLVMGGIIWICIQ